MSIFVHQENNIVPASANLDLNYIAHESGPYIAGLIAWLDVDDPAAGAIGFAMNHVDPTGTTRNSAIVFGTLGLNIAGAYFSTPLEAIQRQSGSSLWELAITLLGSAGTARVSYRFIHFPEEASVNFWP